MKIRHLSKKGDTGEYMIFARRDDHVSAVFYASTRQGAVAEAIKFIGKGSAVDALGAVLDDLAEVLGGLYGKF